MPAPHQTHYTIPKSPTDHNLNSKPDRFADKQRSIKVRRIRFGPHHVPLSTQIWSSSGKYWLIPSNSPKFGPRLVESNPKLAEVGPISPGRLRLKCA